MIENGVAKDYYESKETGAAKVNLKVQLPPDMVCDHCVFQWWYKTGNDIDIDGTCRCRSVMCV